MRLTLFAQDKIHEFFLPNQPSGSYSFDPNPNEDIKLLNIEAVNNEWFIYSKNNLVIMYENNIVEKISLQVNDFYILKTDDSTYLLYTSPLYDESESIYAYYDNINLTIGANSQCNIFYECPYLNEGYIQISKNNGQLFLFNTPNTLLYKNNERITDQNCYISIGDTINFLGLRILFLFNTLIINNPYKGIVINSDTTGMRNIEYIPEKYKNIEVKDIDMYSKDEYFSKSPRIRRIIEEISIKIDPPPEEPKEDEIPALLTAGPMISMGAMSGMTLLNNIVQISNGSTTLDKSWPTLISGVLMMTTSLLWPNLTKAFNKHLARDKRRKIVKTYTKYLEGKESELKKEFILQKNILQENLLTPIECLKIINTRKNNFWCKRIEQNDFLSFRIGIGNIPLKIKVEWPEEGFSIEQDDLKKMAENLIEKYKYIEDSPLEYSFYENFLTAIMGIEKKCYGLIYNILVQLMTFYCYDELKIIVFTDSEKAEKWDFLKYSNYCFDAKKTIRFFATNIDEARNISSYLMQELNFRIQTISDQSDDVNLKKPYYLIITDSYPLYKKVDFLKVLLEVDNNIGYSTIILENKLDKLPSKCINFINLNEGTSGILKNSYENAEITNFKEEIDYSINMMEIVKILSNIPIEIEVAGGKLPEAISFLEMENVGKVEQLNILNRWKNNDSTKSLKAEVGVDEENNLLYLDLHEKFHGPHGLVAGTTGSGKSEFIITYILSMAMNYSPDDIAFILIDYKGGGLAFAFENKTTGVKLPHLAGTITNLDKAEMNRTLVSIDSEVKRRQAEFNKARDMLGESTIDIYKYQKFYHEGKLAEPIPHLFIISDEFAELKSQQPEFMDNLISVARIGRSLGVHLILATQKPSGVVNDQIWSNSKFKVCLKVQDASDSNEMLKKPDAAMLKQSGRFYLQVGMDEYFVLGQSGWAGAKYYPADTIQKQIDKSVNFIDNNGFIIKTIQESTNQVQKEAQGEQIAAVMNEIIKISNQVNKFAKRLWLDNIPSLILVDKVEEKYQIKHTPFNVTATIGEYDAPELQKQGIVQYNPAEDGNLLIIGTDGAEREQLLNALIYSICKNHSTEEVNFYSVDYGSESLRMFTNFPHFGGMVFNGDMEKYSNLLKLLYNEQNKRKKMFVDYGGDYKNYIKNSGQKLPLKIIIFNGFDNIKDNIQSILDIIPEMTRDSSRYGIVYIITANSKSSASTKLNQNINKVLALKLKDKMEYNDALGGKTRQIPADILGRGMLNNGNIHEYQTASIVEDNATLSNYLIELSKKLKEQNTIRVQKIPTLPNHVRLEDVIDEFETLKTVPIGIEKNSLDIKTMDMVSNIGNLILSNKIINTVPFVKSLISLYKNKGIGTLFIDGNNELSEEKNNVSNYFNANFDEVITKIDEYIDNQVTQNIETINVVLIIYGIDKLKNKITEIKKLEDLFQKIKKTEKIAVLIIEEASKLKNDMFDNWYKALINSPEALWIGSGVSDQTILKVSGYTKEYGLEYPNDMGFYIIDGIAKLCKILDFFTQDEEDE